MSFGLPKKFLTQTALAHIGSDKTGASQRKFSNFTRPHVMPSSFPINLHFSDSTKIQVSIFLGIIYLSAEGGDNKKPRWGRG